MASGLQGFYSVFGLVACGHVSGLLMRSDVDRWPFIDLLNRAGHIKGIEE
jgi:hypothetical protein